MQKQLFPHLRSLKLLPPVGDGTVDVMIGNSYPAFMVSLQEVVGEAGEPVARLTRLGWTVAGPTVPGCTLERMEKQKAFLIRQAAPVHWQGADEAEEGQLMGWQKQQFVQLAKRRQ